MKGTLAQIVSTLYTLVPGLSDEAGMQRHLSRGTFWTLVLHFSHIGLTFLISVLLARWLGATSYGSFTHILTWLMVLVTAGSVGADDLLVKELPRHPDGQGPGRELIRFTLLFTLAGSSFLAVLFAILLYADLLPWLSEYASYFAILLPVVPLFALIYWAMAGLRATQSLITAQWPEKAARPASLIVLIVLWYAASDSHIGLTEVIRIVAFTIVLTGFLYAVLVYKKVWPKSGRKMAGPPDRSHWRGQLLIFALLPVLNILNQRIDILILGNLADDEAVGIYGISSRLTEMIPFSLILFQNVFSPLYARYHSSGDLKALEKLVRRGIRLSLILAAPVALTLLVFGSSILRIFGSEFAEGYNVILILSPVQILSLAIGPLAFLLMMVGKGRLAFLIMAGGLLLTAILQTMLIPAYGVEGAAAGRATGLIVTQLAYARATWSTLKIRTI